MNTQPTTLAPVLAALDADFDGAVQRLVDLLRIPSVSTDPAYNDHVQHCAVTLSDELQGLGFSSSVRQTTGHPIVIAHHGGPADAGADLPHLLYYGHYDVQPPEPLELWDSPPFEPTIVDAKHGKRIVARGAVDDKGQVRTFLEAFRAWIGVHGTLPVKVTVLLEGEEESGSPSLDPFLHQAKDELSVADIAIITDTNSWDIDTPAITTRLRGMVYTEITLHGPSRDLHSGLYGGVAWNPIHVLSKLLGDLHDEDGAVAIPGFYDDIENPGPEELAQWDALGFNETAYLADIGLTEHGGERNRPALQRLWARPTCDVNGVWGGYTGVGAKTVIAAQASAKISFRLVPGQDPAKVRAGLQQFLDARTPADGRIAVTGLGGSAAQRIPTGSSYLQAARTALADIYRREAVMIGSGGSIPVVGSMKSILGLDSVMIGFGLEDDRIHSPNEKFELRCFQNGMRSHAALLARVAELKQPAG